jgi:hypothetical protein
MQGKIKKHYAFEQEILANRNGIANLEKYGESLIEANHFAKEDIAARIENLASEWKKLQAASADKGQKLKEASQLVDFIRAVQEVKSWITAKIEIAESQEVGTDVETCHTVQKNFEEFHTDVKANVSRIDAINESAKALIAEGHPQHDVLQEHQDVSCVAFF